VAKHLPNSIFKALRWPPHHGKKKKKRERETEREREREREREERERKRTLLPYHRCPSMNIFPHQM
jgi:hypothetical protein